MFQRRRVPNVFSRRDSHGGPQGTGEDGLLCLLCCGHFLGPTQFSGQEEHMPHSGGQLSRAGPGRPLYWRLGCTLLGSTQHMSTKGWKSDLFHVLSAAITDRHRPGQLANSGNLFLNGVSHQHPWPSYHHSKGVKEHYSAHHSGQKEHPSTQPPPQPRTVVVSSPELDLGYLFSRVQGSKTQLCSMHMEQSSPSNLRVESSAPIGT